ncbi:MAG: hypothetical protein H0W71_08935 [Sphingomonas sp.]|nr:hypothetical protein [Sphingomonas sp.]
MIGAARRSGSLDQAIRDAELNQIDRLIADFPLLRAIAFNGATASVAGRRLLTDQSSIASIDLPSSSAANTAPFALKSERWASLRDYCAD